MTEDTITIERVTTLAIKLTMAAHRVDAIRKESERGDILPADAAEEIEEIMDDLAKCAE